MINLIYERGYYVRFSFAYFYEKLCSLKVILKQQILAHDTTDGSHSIVQYLERQFECTSGRISRLKSVMLSQKGAFVSTLLDHGSGPAGTC